MQKGICYGVSVGPSDGGFITLEAVDIIKKASVIFLPSFPKEDSRSYLAVREIIPEIENCEICCRTTAQSRDAAVMEERHREQFVQVAGYLDAGKNVVFLALGDVGLYSTYIYIHEMLLEAGYESKLISGITSFQAISAYLGQALTCDKDQLHIFPDMTNLSYRLTLPGTKIFMKPKGDTSEAIKLIKSHVAACNGAIAYGVSDFGGAGQIVARSADELDKLTGYFTVVFVKSCDLDYQPSSSFFENRACDYFPCHQGIEHINCMFCYCPMYRFEDCLGHPAYKEVKGKNIKVCTGCTYPHVKEHYENIMNFLKEKI